MSMDHSLPPSSSSSTARLPPDHTVLAQHPSIPIPNPNPSPDCAAKTPVIPAMDRNSVKNVPVNHPRLRRGNSIRQPLRQGSHLARRKSSGFPRSNSIASIADSSSAVLWTNLVNPRKSLVCRSSSSFWEPSLELSCPKSAGNFGQVAFQHAFETKFGVLSIVPIEIILEILEHLDAETLHRLSISSVHFRDLVSSSPLAWFNQYRALVDDLTTNNDWRFGFTGGVQFINDKSQFLHVLSGTLHGRESFDEAMNQRQQEIELDGVRNIENTSKLVKLLDANGWKVQYFHTNLFYHHPSTCSVCHANFSVSTHAEDVEVDFLASVGPWRARICESCSVFALVEESRVSARFLVDLSFVDETELVPWEPVLDPIDRAFESISTATARQDTRLRPKFYFAPQLTALAIRLNGGTAQSYADALEAQAQQKQAKDNDLKQSIRDRELRKREHVIYLALKFGILKTEETVSPNHTPEEVLIVVKERLLHPIVSQEFGRGPFWKLEKYLDNSDSNGSLAVLWTVESRSLNTLKSEFEKLSQIMPRVCRFDKVLDRYQQLSQSLVVSFGEFLKMDMVQAYLDDAHSPPKMPLDAIFDAIKVFSSIKKSVKQETSRLLGLWLEKLDSVFKTFVQGLDTTLLDMFDFDRLDIEDFPDAREIARAAWSLFQRSALKKYASSQLSAPRPAIYPTPRTPPHNSTFYIRYHGLLTRTLKTMSNSTTALKILTYDDKRLAGLIHDFIASKACPHHESKCLADCIDALFRRWTLLRRNESIKKNLVAFGMPFQEFMCGEWILHFKCEQARSEILRATHVDHTPEEWALYAKRIFRMETLYRAMEESLVVMRPREFTFETLVLFDNYVFGRFPLYKTIADFPSSSSGKCTFRYADLIPQDVLDDVLSRENNRIRRMKQVHYEFRLRGLDESWISKEFDRPRRCLYNEIIEEIQTDLDDGEVVGFRMMQAESRLSEISIIQTAISHYIYTPSVTFRDFDVVFSYAVRLNSAATRIDQLKARLSRDIQFQKLFDDAYGVHEFLNGWYMECAFRSSVPVKEYALKGSPIAATTTVSASSSFAPPFSTSSSTSSSSAGNNPTEAHLDALTADLLVFSKNLRTGLIGREECLAMVNIFS